MHPRVAQLPPPTPDYRRMLRVLRRERPDRVPLIELAVAPEVVNACLGLSPTADPSEIARRNVQALHRLGHDVVKVSAPIPFRVPRLATGTQPGIQWLDEHGGPIRTAADVERFPWPTIDAVDFTPVQAALEVLPEGMALLGFSGGVLEFAMDLMGMEGLMLATRRTPELVAAVIERVGGIIHDVFAAYCRFDRICALWLGDDLGHKHGTLLAPKWLEQHIVPWYRRFADLAHQHGRPFLLHSCGDTHAVMPAIVDTGIDAKHSFEDGIEPVETFYERWYGQLAVLGGVDLHLLATGSAAEIAARTQAILTHAAPAGGYACGSGNSIPNYVPVDAYLTLVETVARFNDRL